MLDERSLAVAHKLLRYQIIDILDFEKEMKLTRRQLTYSLEKINDWLRQNGIKEIIFSNTIITMPESAKRYVLNTLEKQKKSDYVYSAKERMEMIYIILFCLDDEYISLDDLTFIFDVSKPTIIADIRALNQKLYNDHLEIQYNRTKGYYIAGDEGSIRYKLMQISILIIEENEQSILKDIISKLSLYDYDQTYSFLEKRMQEFQIRFVETRLDEVVFIFIFLCKHKKQLDFPEDYIYAIKLLKETKEYLFARFLLSDLNITSEEKIVYLSSWIIGLSIGDYNDYTPDRGVINTILRNLLIRFDSITGNSLSDNKDLWAQIYQHLRPAYYRLLFHLPIVNTLKEKIKLEYKPLYAIVAESMKPLVNLFGGTIPDDEIAYITMYFASAVMNTKVQEKKHKKAIILCPNGIGTSFILYKELSDLLPQFEFMKPLEMKYLKKINADFDIIFSTKLTMEIYELNVPYIIVNPILSENEKQRIVREVAFVCKDSIMSHVPINQLINVIEKSASVDNYNQLKDDLYSFFNQQSNIENEKEGGPMLSEIINENLIQLHINAVNWEDAIRKSAQPLIDQHKASSSYVDGMIENTKEMGAYIVITKHVALPHARPEKGINKLAITISTLKQPIAFGNKDNDPVKYVFCLSAEDDISHLRAMAELVELLDKKEFFDVLDNSKNGKEIYDYICCFEKNINHEIHE